jgi:hypothetical protein
MTDIQLRDLETGEIVTKSTDTMNNQHMATEAMNQFLYAVDQQLIDLNMGAVHPDIKVYFDQPMGETRLTYGLEVNGTIKSVVVFAMSEPYKGAVCFDASYATCQDAQGKGLASQAFQKAIDELTNGLKRNGVEQFYLEMKVDKDNAPSNAIAKRFATEQLNEKGVNRYFKKVTL